MTYKLYDRMRHKEAFEAAGRPGEAGDFEGMRDAKHALVVTFRKSGDPVPTPVWIGMDEQGKAYFRAESDTGKVKRLKRDPHVRIGPCDNRGKPKGPLAEGTARILPPSEEARAEKVIQSNFGLGRRMYESTAGNVPAVYVEVSPAP